MYGRNKIAYFIWKLLIPIAIIRIRIIQYRYKRLTVKNISHNQSSQITTLLILLQAKEQYFRDGFEAWGRYHPSFSFTYKQKVRHIKFMNWLFPEKDFKEFPLVIWHKYEAVTYYHNKIFALTKGRPFKYEVEIPAQLKKWKDNYEKNYK